MTVKYIAFDGTEFDNEKKCKEYEKANSVKIRAEICNVRYGLKLLDDFCDFWVSNLHYECEKCPLNNLCGGRHDKFVDYFNKANPFSHIDEDGIIIEED